MASPPNYSVTSPHAPSPLALPRQRPNLSLPTGSIARRKTSITSATSSSHPLRQTSFPPQNRYGSPGGGENSVLYSPTDSLDISDSEIRSAISGQEPAKKRKRGEKRNRGRPPKNPPARVGSQSVLDDTKSRRSGVRGESAVNGDVDAEEDDEDEDDADGEKTGAYEQDRFIANDRARIDLHQQMPLLQQERHDSWHRAKLKTADVRRLVNQTLSQSVPANVVTVVQAYTKMFSGLLIEGAREVQSEWEAVSVKRPDGQDNPAAKRLRQSVEDEDNDSEQYQLKSNGAHESSMSVVQKAPDSHALGLSKLIAEWDRGPLQPDHLREALRRHKKSRYGGAVGFTGLSLEGRDVAAARAGRHRLFR